LFFTKSEKEAERIIIKRKKEDIGYNVNKWEYLCAILMVM
jgi:hypothetical protein